jgi:hypothetical protein
VRLIHQQHEIGQAGRVVEVALADALRQALDARLLVPALPRQLIFEMLKTLIEQRRPRIERHVSTRSYAVARHDVRLLASRTPHQALEHVLGRVRREVADQLLVDRQVRREHEEVVQPVLGVEVRDERAHQARLADARREREAQ